jgi:hypothetical protein
VNNKEAALQAEERKPEDSEESNDKIDWQCRKEWPIWG